MKKWIILLTAITLIGATSSAAIAGRIYYKEMKTYEAHDKKEIQTKDIKNIYINSAVPVTVEPTDGPAYVEFNQKFTDILGKAPTYKLDVENKGNNAYINVEQTKDIEIWFGIKENMATCTVYLPKMAIDKLDIKGIRNYYHSFDYGKSIDFNLGQMDIKELNINTQSNGNIYLDGNYEKVNVNQNYGRIEMDSKSPANVTISGDIECDLKGSYSKVKVEGNNNNITINSDTPSEVWIRNGNGSVVLDGKYQKVDVETWGYSNINVKSDTLCKVNVDSDNGDIKLEGAIEEMSVKNYSGALDINTIVIPKRMRLIGSDNKINLFLPNNTPGIEVTYQESGDNGYYSYNDDNESEWEEERENLRSDFMMKKSLSDNNIRRYTYGDASTKVFLEADSRNVLYILDNGYISELAKTK